MKLSSAVSTISGCTVVSCPDGPEKEYRMKGLWFSFKKWFSLGTLAMAVLVVAVAAAPAQTVLAAGVAQETPPPAQGQEEDTDTPRPREGLLAQEFRRQQRQVKRQENALEQADQWIPRAQERIQALKDQSKNTAELEDALAQFQDQLGTARQAHDRAAALVQPHAGFDEDGKVVDLAQARDTVQQIRGEVVDFRQTLRDGLKDLRAALQKYRQENPTATPAVE
jgi:TolA-binding protein